MNVVVLWSIVTLFRFGQSFAIWWFILTLFKRDLKEHKSKFLISSFFISLMILFYNVIHVPNAFLLFAFEVPIFTVSHLLILKKGIGVAVIETIIGYYLYRITEIDIAMLFSWAHIFSIRTDVTRPDAAILMQFILPFVVILAFQMLLVRNHWGYYLINNEIMPNKWWWIVLTFNSGVILYYFKRLLHDLNTYTYYAGWDEQLYLIFFITLNLSILWWINKTGWEKHYERQAISRFYQKKSFPLSLKKTGKHS